LTAAVRVGVKIERPGRENGSAGAELENVMELGTLAARERASEPANRWISQFRFRTVVVSTGSGSGKS